MPTGFWGDFYTVDGDALAPSFNPFTNDKVRCLAVAAASAERLQADGTSWWEGVQIGLPGALDSVGSMFSGIGTTALLVIGGLVLVLTMSGRAERRVLRANPSTFCSHGNRRSLGLCPDCDAVRMTKRQRKADRARFAAQLQRIKGR